MESPRADLLLALAQDAHDSREAAAFIRAAADLGSVDAIFELSEMYEIGRGVEVDESRAVLYTFKVL